MNVIKKIRQYGNDILIKIAVQKKIIQCIDNNEDSLNFTNMGLKELPKNLPDSLLYLYCNNNQLIELPTNLPVTLLELHCNDNQIIQLPDNLPSSLQVLNCGNNPITKFPTKLNHGRLVSLQHLFCHNTKITRLPSNFLTSPKYIYCQNNKYLHIPKKYAKRIGLDETPNYNHKARCIQRIWKAKKCKQIMVDMICNNNNALHDSFKSYGDLNIACTSASRCTRRTGSQLFALLKKLDNNNICE